MARCSAVDRIAKIAFPVVSNAKFVREIFGRRIGFGNFIQPRERVIEFALLRKSMNLFVRRRRVWGRLRLNRKLQKQ